MHWSYTLYHTQLHIQSKTQFLIQIQAIPFPPPYLASVIARSRWSNVMSQVM